MSQTQIMVRPAMLPASPLDTTWLEHQRRLIGSITHAEQMQSIYSRWYEPPARVGSAARLLEPQPIVAKVYDVRDADGILRPREVVISGKRRRSRIGDVVRVVGPRKQVAARMARPTESMDDRWVTDVRDGEVREERVVAERAPHGALQGSRTTNFKRGELLSGGQRAIRESQRAIREYDAKRPEPVDPTLKKIEELEARIKKLMFSKEVKSS